MRLNVNQYRAILSEKGILNEEVRIATGLSKKTYLWILENGYIECETLERIADVIGCPVREILLPDSTSYNENVIEWAKDKKIATLSLSQGRTISKVRKLAEKYPEDVQIIAENEDGSMYAHIPVAWIRINPSRTLTEEQKKELSKRLGNNF